MDPTVPIGKVEEAIALLEELAACEYEFISGNARCALAYLENCRFGFPETHLS